MTDEKSRCMAGKNVVVVGGTGGLGLAAAEALVAEGARVVVVGRREDAAEEAERQLGAGCRAITGDALRCRSAISTNSGRILCIAAIASGTTIEAPSAVMVPETLITGRRPSSLRGSMRRSLIRIAPGRESGSGSRERS